MIARTIKHFDDLFHIISNNFGEFWGAHLHVWSLKHFIGTRAEIHWLGRGRMPVLLRSVKHKNNSHAQYYNTSLTRNGACFRPSEKVKELLDTRQPFHHKHLDT